MGCRPCPGSYNCFSEGPYWIWCLAKTYECPPSAGPPEIALGPNCETNQCVAGHPVSLTSGNTFIEEVDVRNPGLGGGLSLTRTWNSMWPPTQAAYQTGMFGLNWRSTFEERVFVGSDNYIKWARGDGSFWSFGMGAPGWRVAAPANGGATLALGFLTGLLPSRMANRDFSMF